MVNPLSQALACHCSSHAIQCRIYSWDTKEVLLASLPSAGVSMTGICSTDTTKGKKHLSAAVELDRQDNLPITTKGQGQKGLGCEVPVLCPVHLLISLLLCTCWKFSPRLLATCLSVYKHKAEKQSIYHSCCHCSLYSSILHVSDTFHTVQIIILYSSVRTVM